MPHAVYLAGLSAPLILAASLATATGIERQLRRSTVLRWGAGIALVAASVALLMGRWHDLTGELYRLSSGA